MREDEESQKNMTRLLKLLVKAKEKNTNTSNKNMDGKHDEINDAMSDDEHEGSEEEGGKEEEEEEEEEWNDNGEHINHTNGGERCTLLVFRKAEGKVICSLCIHIQTHTHIYIYI